MGMLEPAIEFYRNDNVYSVHPQPPSLRGYLRLLLARGFTREDIVKELSVLDGRDFLEGLNGKNSKNN